MALALVLRKGGALSSRKGSELHLAFRVVAFRVEVKPKPQIPGTKNSPPRSDFSHFMLTPEPARPQASALNPHPKYL